MEEFRIINDYPNYSVSNFGNVRNDLNKAILKIQTNKDGYKTIHIKCLRKFLKIHKLVAEAFIENLDNNEYIEHIDSDKSNNNADNLRWITLCENNSSVPILEKNKSGFKGVCFDKRRNKWIATITKNYKFYHLGEFTNKEDAINARKLKANELFGEFTNNSERIVNFNIKIPKNTKLNINIEIDDDEELKLLEQEFLEKMK